MPDQSVTRANTAFRVLVVVSRPLDQKELPTIADQWALINGLAAVKAPVEIKFLRPPTIEGLQTEILSGYDVLHFDGHGAFAIACPNCKALNAPGSPKCGGEKCDASLEEEKPRGYLAFEQEDGTEDALAADELAEILKTVPGLPTKLVILSACESAKGKDESLAASLIKSGVPCVLGMNVSVPVALTIALSKPFYSGLGAGRTISNAFKSGLSAISRLPDVEAKDADSKDVKWIKAREVPKLLGDGGMKLTKPNTHGSLILEKTNLFGVPDYDFVGEFIRGDPPQGRKGLLFQVIKALNNGEKLVVLTGQGGIGKSVLAAVAARRMAWRYPGGVFWRSAENIELGLNELLDSFANIFGHEFRTLELDAKQDAVLGYLGNYQTQSLIVVDNAEDIKDKALWRFLEGLPQPSAALVTTREARPREGTQIAIHQMETSEAVRLFVLEARRRSSHFGEKHTKQDESALDQIIRLLDGHPLGIKLAAGLVSSASLEGILGKIMEAPPKEVSDRFDFSYNTLKQSQKELLQRTAAFGGTFAEWAIQAVSEGSLFEDDRAEPLSQWKEDLSELVQKSFVDFLEFPAWDESDNEIVVRCYRLHPLMRLYAGIKAGDQAMKIHHGRAAYLFLEYAEHFRADFPALEEEHENILSGAEFANTSENWEMVERFAWTLVPYLRTSGHWRNLRTILENFTKAAEKLGDKSGLSVSLQELGNLDIDTGNYDEARRLCQESLKINQELGDKSGVSRSLHSLGALAHDTGDYGEARRLYQDSFKIAQELGDKNGVSISLQQLGMLAKNTGDYGEARRLHQDSLKIAQELGDRSGVSRSLHSLGALAHDTGNYDEARRLYQDSLKINQDLGDKNGVSRLLHQLGMLAKNTGDYGEARRLYQDSLKIAQELGDKSGVLRSLHQLGTLAENIGDYGEARRLYQDSLKIAQELGDKIGVVRSLHSLGVLAHDTGDYGEARRLYQDSLKIAQELGDKIGVSRSLHSLGALAHDTGDYGEARRLYQESLKIAQGLGDKSSFSGLLHSLGALAHDTGDYGEARRLYQESLKIKQDLGNKNGIALTKAHLALLEESLGNIEAALKVIKQAEISFKELGSPYAGLAGEVKKRLEEKS